MDQQNSNYMQRPPVNSYGGDPRGIPSPDPSIAATAPGMKSYSGNEAGFNGMSGRFYPAGDGQGYFWDQGEDTTANSVADSYQQVRPRMSDENGKWYDDMMKILAMQSMDDVKQKVSDYLGLQQLWQKFSGLQGNQKTLK